MRVFIFLRRVLPVLAAAVLLTGLSAGAQQPGAPGNVQKPVTPKMPSHSLRGFTIPDEPQHPEPAATEFRDSKYQVSFHVPAGWNFERKDGLLSNYGVEIHPGRRTDVRGVAAINFNPWPPTTFAGATFYYSVLPRANAQVCDAQLSTGKKMKPLPDAEIAGMLFHHAHEQHGTVCTEARDEVFTAKRGQSCLRFDLVVNTFCSETSGAMEISPDQLKDVDARLAGILGSVRIDGK